MHDDMVEEKNWLSSSLLSALCCQDSRLLTGDAMYIVGGQDWQVGACGIPPLLLPWLGLPFNPLAQQPRWYRPLL